jgi:hypothetical protein
MKMSTLHITSGDNAGGTISKTGIDGDLFVWHDIMYTGPRNPGWPNADTLLARAAFLESETGGGLKKDFLLESLKNQYDKLKNAASYDRIVLWFDACLFDQSMLAHILTCLKFQGITKVELLCVDAFPGIDPYDGLGQLTAEQLVSVYNQRRPVTTDQFAFAVEVDKAFALQDKSAFAKLSSHTNAPLPWIPAAISRWLLEIPESGLGRLEQLALDAVKSGCTTPIEIYKHTSKNDSHPQFWGDTTLWGKINSLADRQMVYIEGPTAKLPVWECQGMDDYRVRCGEEFKI